VSNPFQYRSLPSGTPPSGGDSDAPGEHSWTAPHGVPAREQRPVPEPGQVHSGNASGAFAGVTIEEDRPARLTRSSAGVPGSVIAAIVVAIVVAAGGIGVGRIWAEVVPRVTLIKVEGGFVYADSEPEQPIAADGWFAILAVAAGLLFAVLAWVLLSRYRGVAVLLGLVVGSLIGAWLAYRVGHDVGLAEYRRLRGPAAVGTRLEAPLGLRITDLREQITTVWRPTGVAAIQALAAAFAYTAFAGFSTHGSLRGPDPAPHHQPYP
jgi:hypothetical protein